MDPITTHLLSSISNEVVKAISSFTKRKVKMIKNFDKELEQMANTLGLIKDALEKAENRFTEDEGFETWLKELQDAVYDIEEMLDDFQNSKNWDRWTKDSSKIHSMNERLNTISKRKEQYTREEDTNNELDKIITDRDTNSAVIEGGVHGRDEEKEQIVTMLLDDEYCEDNITIIPIVGLGGIGKTTLAQFVFNDERIKEQFDLRIWVYVSMKFNLDKIAEAIIGSASRKEYYSLEYLSTEVPKQLEAKKFLIVMFGATMLITGQN